MVFSGLPHKGKALLHAPQSHGHEGRRIVDNVWVDRHVEFWDVAEELFVRHGAAICCLERYTILTGMEELVNSHPKTRLSDQVDTTACID